MSISANMVNLYLAIIDAFLNIMKMGIHVLALVMMHWILAECNQ